MPRKRSRGRREAVIDVVSIDEFDDAEQGAVLHYSPDVLFQRDVINLDVSPQQSRRRNKPLLPSPSLAVPAVPSIDTDAVLARRLQREEEALDRRTAIERADEMLARSIFENEGVLDPTPPRVPFMRGRGRYRGNWRGNRGRWRGNRGRFRGGGILLRGAEARNPALFRLSMMDRDFTDDDYEMLLSLDEGRKQGIDVGVLSALPIFKYKSDTVKTDDEKKCAICLGEYEEEEELRRLPCLHAFHQECIDRWMHENRICPICKWDCSDV